MVDEPQKALKKATLIWGCRPETEAKCRARPFPLATQWWVFAASGSWNLKGRAGKKGSVPRSQRTEGTWYPLRSTENWGVQQQKMGN